MPNVRSEQMPDRPNPIALVEDSVSLFVGKPPQALYEFRARRTNSAFALECSIRSLRNWSIAASRPQHRTRRP